MTAGIAIKEGLYHVEVYMTMKGETYPSWHTCRAFLYQGDALLFRDLCNTHKLDPTRFALSYRSGAVCTNFKMNNGQPKLTMKHGTD